MTDETPSNPATGNTEATEAATAPPHWWDEPTGWILGGCDIDLEVPAGAMANFERWRAAVEAGDPEAVATYDRLLPGPLKEIKYVTFIADRIDDRDPAVEREIVDAIFGTPYGAPMHALMRDEFMRRREVTEYAIERLRLRLLAGCAAPGDAERVRRCAADTMTDRMLHAFCWACTGQPHDTYIVKEAVFGSYGDDQRCLITDILIPAGERCAVFRTVFDDGLEYQAPISKAGVWCLFALRELDLGYELAPAPQTTADAVS